MDLSSTSPSRLVAYNDPRQPVLDYPSRPRRNSTIINNSDQRVHPESREHAPVPGRLWLLESQGIVLLAMDHQNNGHDEQHDRIRVAHKQHLQPGNNLASWGCKRWLTPGATPPGWVSPGPPCTITNSHGTVAMFVEIDGVKRASLVNEDCTGSYDAVNGGSSNGGSYCDSTFNFYDPAVVPNYSTSCTSSSDPSCYGRIHSEIDHDWKAAKYCGASTTCDDAALNSQTTTSTLIDFQGFIYWDPGNLNQAWHSFSGWEIHPLTGWRVHQSNPSLTASFTFSPSAPTVGQAVTFTGTASGGTSPYAFDWSFGDGATGTGNPAIHSFSTTV